MEIKNMAAVESTRNKEWKNDQKEYEKHESLLDTFSFFQKENLC